MCLPKDLQKLPTVPEPAFEDALAKIAMAGQACVSFFSIYAANEKKKAAYLKAEKDELQKLKAKVTELTADKNAAQQAASIAQGQLQRAEEKVFSVHEQLRKLREDHKKELEEADAKAYEDGQNFSKEKLIKQARGVLQKGINKGRGQAMRQGYPQGWRDALKKAKVLEDSELWNVPPAPEFYVDLFLKEKQQAEGQ